MRIHVIGGLAFFAFLTAASATPAGQLFIRGCAGNEVIVTAFSVDWQPTGGPTGCIETTDSTNVTYSGGTLLAGVQGTIEDLPAADANDFMKFGVLSFDLVGLGPGSTNTDCANVDAVGESCSVFLGSQFLLTFNSPGNTTVSLHAFGTVTDADAAVSTWDGSFSVTLFRTPAQIQADIGSPINPAAPADTNGSIQSGHNGSFLITLGSEVPEPSTYALMGVGLLGFAFARKRARS